LIEITAAKNPSGLIRQLGKSGKYAGSPEGLRKRNTQSKEAYILRRYLLWRLECGDISFPLSVYHGDAPDFEIDEAGEIFGIEFTEASDEQSGRRYANLDWNLLSEALGERITSKVVINVIDHVHDALSRKSKKHYASKKTDLIIYPNSPARMAVGLFANSENQWNEAILNAKYDVSSFRNVYLFWFENDCKFNLINDT